MSKVVGIFIVIKLRVLEENQVITSQYTLMFSITSVRFYDTIFATVYIASLRRVVAFISSFSLLFGRGLRLHCDVYQEEEDNFLRLIISFDNRSIDAPAIVRDIINLASYLLKHWKRKPILCGVTLALSLSENRLKLYRHNTNVSSTKSSYWYYARIPTFVPRRF